MIARMRLAPIVPMRATLAGAPNGSAYPHHTLRLMRDAIRRGRLDPAIISAAHSITYLTPERNACAEVAALFEWVRDHVRYTADVLGVETLTDPAKVLQRLSGDCDDQTALLCALAESIGYPTRLVMAGYQSQEFEHVYCEIFCDGEWWACDPIDRAHPFGFAPPDPLVMFTESV